MIAAKYLLALALPAALTAAAGKALPPKWKHLSSRTGELPLPPGSDQQTLCLLLDVDRDRKNDFVIGCRQGGPALVWFRREVDTWSPHVIEPDDLPIEAGGAQMDVDGDGDLDLIAGEDYSGNKLYWWENPYPKYDPKKRWIRNEIKSGGAKKHHDQIAADFDGDRKPELVFWNQGAHTLFHAFVPENPREKGWPSTPIWDSGAHAEGVAAGDIDTDGKTDLLAGGRWFKLQQGPIFIPYVIDDAQRNSRIAVGDLNGDRRPDVVMAPGDAVGRLKWYEHRGDPTASGAWTGHDLLGQDVKHGHSLAVADVDGDGKLDVFCGEMRKWTAGDDNPAAKMWLFLGDGKGGFTRSEIASGYGVHEARVGDLNGDGLPDILAKPYNWETPRIDAWLQEK
jgi:hypothetical protein